MSDKFFVDTNILIYAHDASKGAKHERAVHLVERLWDSRTGVLSTQVLQEFCFSLRRKRSSRSVPRGGTPTNPELFELGNRGEYGRIDSRCAGNRIALQDFVLGRADCSCRAERWSLHALFRRFKCRPGVRRRSRGESPHRLARLGFASSLAHVFTGLDAKRLAEARGLHYFLSFAGAK